MSSRLVLDTGPVSRLCSPHRHREENRAFFAWFRRQLVNGTELCLPEIADYEVRRGLLRVGARAQLATLDGLPESIRFLPFTREATLLAAKLWADSQRKGIPTGDPKALDGDAFLAAQALVANATVVTENVGHISRFVTVLDWRRTDDTVG